MIEFFVWFIGGVICGAIVGTLSTRLYLRSKSSGNLIIANDTTDGSNYIFLEMNRWSMEQLKAQQNVELKVVDRTQKKHFL
ncbi:MAG: hypothetical protein K6E34_14855 [Lachnospiraceae bacterium]|nr:hypothetical protein [Lachnospiraceae bacterium]